MDGLIFKVCAVGIIAATLAIAIKKDNPVFALILSLAASILILFMIMPRLQAVLQTLESVLGFLGGNARYATTAVKVIGIAWAAEFGANACADAGEAGVAAKIELAGKVLIMAASAPVVFTLLEQVLGLL